MELHFVTHLALERRAAEECAEPTPNVVQHRCESLVAEAAMCKVTTRQSSGDGEPHWYTIAAYSHALHHATFLSGIGNLNDAIVIPSAQTSS
jgi:hypothetical protein